MIDSIGAVYHRKSPVQTGTPPEHGAQKFRSYLTIRGDQNYVREHLRYNLASGNEAPSISNPNGRHHSPRKHHRAPTHWGREDPCGCRGHPFDEAIQRTHPARPVSGSHMPFSRAASRCHSGLDRTASEWAMVL